MKVPDFCYALNNMTINPMTKEGKVIKVRAMETGFYPTTLRATQQTVDKLNAELGVDKPTAQAMVDASMFGWNCYLSCLQTYKEREHTKYVQDKIINFVHESKKQSRPFDAQLVILTGYEQKDSNDEGMTDFGDAVRIACEQNNMQAPTKQEEKKARAEFKKEFKRGKS